MEASAIVESLARSSGALSPGDIRQMFRVCEAGKETLATAALRLVSRAQGAPMLNSKSADGTPITVVSRTQEALPSGKKVHRAGRTCEEFLVKNQFLRTVLPTGECFSKVMLQDPLPLANGKAADKIFQACLKDWRSLRQLGHSGCAIEHYAFDRCGITFYEKAWRQWHAMSGPTHDALSPGLPAGIFRLTEFVVVTPCAVHDANNAFKWALASRFDNKDLLRDAYICAESLRNSWAAITTNLCEWIALRLSFAEEMTMEGILEWAELWTSLSVEPETVEVLSSTLQLRFQDGRLWVAKSVQDDPASVSTIAAALQATWRFTRWTESRFLSVGASSRTLVAGLLTGIEDLVNFIQSHAKASMYYLGGFKRMQGEVKLFIVEAAVVSRVTEGALLSLLDDPRVCNTYEDLWRSVSEEMLWIAQLSMSTWSKLASAGGTRAATLRSECIAAAHVSKHFFWRRVLEPAGQRPWALARGDVRQNLESLREEVDMPSEAMTQQLWLLLQSDFPVQLLIRTVQLLQDVGWTTLPVEQQHGSVASLRRLHPEYGTATLTARALVLMLRRLLPSQSREERELARLSQQLNRLLSKQPSKIGARQAMLSEWFGVLRARQWRDRPKPLGIETRLLTRHHVLWMKASLASKQMYALQAKRQQAEKQAAIAQDIDGVRAAKELLMTRMREEGRERKPLVMSEAAFDQEDLELFSRLLSDDAFSGKRLEARRVEAQRVPGATPSDMAAAMAAQVVPTPAETRMPAWAADVARHRDFFHNCVLVCFDASDSVTYWKVLYAVQSPFYVALTQLRLTEDFVQFGPVTRENWGLLASQRPRYAFHCNFAAHSNAACIPDRDDLAIFVLTGVRHEGGTRCVTSDFMTPLGNYIASLPEKVRAQRARAESAPQKRSKGDDDVQELPWLANLDLKLGFHASGQFVLPNDATAREAATEAQPLEEEAFEQSLRDLEVARLALKSEEDLSRDDFGTRVLGGAWLMKTKGIPFDAIQGFARTEIAKDFCGRRGLQRSVRFEYMLYGGEACGIMARAWGDRLQWLLNHELSGTTSTNTPFGPEILLQYVEPSEFAKLAVGATGKLVGRVRQIRAIP